MEQFYVSITREFELIGHTLDAHREKFHPYLLFIMCALVVTTVVKGVVILQIKQQILLDSV